MFKVIIITFFISTNIYASSWFLPDSDSALLIEILGAELQATAGILELADTSSNLVNKMQSYHKKVENFHSKAMQAEYYINTLSNFNLKKINSIRDLHENLKSTKATYQEGITLAIFNNFKQNQLDRKLAFNYLKDSANASKTVDGAIVTARSNSLNSMKLVNLSDSLNLLNQQVFVLNKLNIKKQREYQKNLKIKKRRWGIYD